jgi:cell division protein FtsB
MFDFQQKNKIRKFLYSRPVVAIVVIIAVYSLYSTWSIYQKMLHSRQAMEQSQKELLTLATQNDSLDSTISELQTNAGVEKEIRSKFGVAKPGENMAVIVQDSGTSSQSTSTPKSLWNKFLNLFGF